MRMAAAVIGVACLVSAQAALGAEDGFALPKAEGEAELVATAGFTVDKMRGLAQFVAGDDIVAASVAYEDPPVADDPYGPGMVRQPRWALAAWRPDGTLLWKADYPRAYRLAVGDGEIALAFDDGSLHSERGIIWVDAATGRELRRSKLGGRPLHMRYYPQARRWVLVVMPQHRLQTLEGAWMEVVGFGPKGTAAWTWKYDCTQLGPLRMDGKALVVYAYGRAEGSAVVRLDPETGREIWRAGWDQSGPAPAEVEPPAPRSLDALVPLAGWKALKFLDLDTGKAAASLALPDIAGAGYHMAAGHGDRFYRTCADLKGITIAAYRFPSGERIWADETGTASYRGPTAWRENVVFLTQKLTEGLTGQFALTELRVYAPEGKLLANARCEYDPQKPSPFMWNTAILPQVVGDRLYAVSNQGILALRLRE